MGLEEGSDESRISSRLNYIVFFEFEPPREAPVSPRTGFGDCCCPYYYCYCHYSISISHGAL